MKFTDTQINDGKNKVAKIFIDKFYEFIEDLKNTNGTGYEFSRKYGATFHPESVEKHTKNTLTNATWFSSQFFNGGNIDFWTKNGFEKELIWELVKEGFLSEFTSWRSGSKTFYYIKQDTVKDIFRNYKA